MIGRREDQLILRGFAFGFVFLLLAKFGGAAKEMIVAYAYGTSPVVDAYALAFTLVTWPVTLGAMCANALLVPEFASASTSPGSRAPDVPGLLLKLLPFSVLIAIAFFVLLRFGSGLLSPSPEVAAALSGQAAGMILVVPAGLAASILAARLIARQRQISALLESVPAVFLSLCILGLAPVLRSETILAWGTGIGMTLYFAALVLADRSALARPQVSSESVDRVSQSVIIVLFAQVVFSLGGALLDQIAASSLPQAQNAVLAYASRLLILATALGATAIGRAVLPVLSATWAVDLSEGRALLRRWFMILFVGGLLAAVVGYAVVPSVVGLLFERGSFTSADTLAVSELVRIGLLQLPFYFSSLILAQVAIVQRCFGLVLLSNFLAVGVKLLLVSVFLSEFGASVLMYGTAAMYLVSVVILGGGYLAGRVERCELTS